MASGRFDANQFINDFERALNTKDFQNLMRYYDSDVEFTDEQGKIQRGLDAYRKAWENWTGSFSETKLTVRQAVQNGNDVAILQGCKGRHTGEFEILPGERIPATNKSFEVPYGEFIRLDDQGKIVRDYAVVDRAQVMMQLGILPSAAQEGAQRRAVQR